MEGGQRFWVPFVWRRAVRCLPCRLPPCTPPPPPSILLMKNKYCIYVLHGLPYQLKATRRGPRSARGGIRWRVNVTAQQACLVVVPNGVRDGPAGEWGEWARLRRHPAQHGKDPVAWRIFSVSGVGVRTGFDAWAFWDRSACRRFFARAYQPAVVLLRCMYILSFVRCWHS